MKRLCGVEQRKPSFLKVMVSVAEHLGITRWSDSSCEKGGAVTIPCPRLAMKGFSIIGGTAKLKAVDMDTNDHGLSSPVTSTKARFQKEFERTCFPP